MRVTFRGLPGRGVGAKDLILGLIAQETTAGANGYFVEYAGEAIRALSMDGRMTISNMSIEWGARAGLIAPDETTFAYLEGRPGIAGRVRRIRRALGRLRLRPRRAASTPRCSSTPRRSRRRSRGAPTPARPCRSPAGSRSRATTGRGARSSTWAWRRARPCRTSRSTASSSAAARTAGSVTCARRPGRARRPRRAGVRALVVPGSMAVKRAAEEEGLERVFIEAGFEWRNAGCSMCLGMNPDVVCEPRRARRLDQQSQPRGPSGPSRPHAPDRGPRWRQPPRSQGHLTDVRAL